MVKALEALLDGSFLENEEDEEHPLGARRADALACMAESSLASPPDALTGGERYMVQLRADRISLQSGNECGLAELEGGPDVSAENVPAAGLR